MDRFEYWLLCKCMEYVKTYRKNKQSGKEDANVVWMEGCIADELMEVLRQYRNLREVI